MSSVNLGITGGNWGSRNDTNMWVVILANTLSVRNKLTFVSDSGVSRLLSSLMRLQQADVVVLSKTLPSS